MPAMGLGILGEAEAVGHNYRPGWSGVCAFVRECGE